MTTTIDSTLHGSLVLDRYRPRPEWFHNPEGIHGVGHAARVLAHVDAIAEWMLSQDSTWWSTAHVAPSTSHDYPVDLEVVRWAAVVHDVGRIDDGPDRQHGERSAAWFLANAEAVAPHLTEVQRQAVASTVRWHVAWDHQVPAEARTPEWFCLKDADALDRVRLNGGPKESLDPKLLRTEHGIARAGDARLLFEVSRFPEIEGVDEWDLVAQAGTAVMPPQLHLNRMQLDQALVQPITNGFEEPYGGLWTATYDPGNRHEWASRALLFWATEKHSVLGHGHGFRVGPMTYENPSDNPSSGPVRCWLLIPNPDARIATVNCYDDWFALGERFGWTPYRCHPPDPKRDPEDANQEPFCYGAPRDPNEEMLAPNFEAMSQIYDAIYVTIRGVKSFRGTGNRRWQGWGTEMTVWFRWAFSRVREIDVRQYRIRGQSISNEQYRLNQFELSLDTDSMALRVQQRALADIRHTSLGLRQQQDMVNARLRQELYKQQMFGQVAMMIEAAKLGCRYRR